MISVEQIYDEIVVSYYNANGGITIEKIKIPESQKYKWEICAADDPKRDKEFLSHTGKPVKKISSRYLDKYRIYEILHSFVSEESRQRFFSYNVPTKWFMDIETSVSDKFPDVDNPIEQILSLAFCNETGDVYITGLKELSTSEKDDLYNRIQTYFDDAKNYRDGYKPIKKKFRIKYLYYPSENQMVADFYYKYVQKMPLLTGWNFLKFDIAYMNSRAKRLDIDYTKFSPKGTVYKYSIADKYDKTKRQIVEIPMHRGIIDYLEIFAKWDTSIKIKSNMSLDSIANEVLGVTKLHYSGTLTQFYNNDPIGFYAYNAIDTILVQLIDEKSKTFNTMLKLAERSKVPLIESLFASMMLEAMSSEKYYKKKKVFVRGKKLETVESYTGGYVEEPGTGLFKNVVIVDFTSQFPSNMMFGNTGIDTYLGTTKDEGKTYIDALGVVHKVNPEKHIYMSSGAVYDKSNGDSVMRQILGDLFQGRVDAKKKAKACDADIEILERMLEAV